MTPDANPERYKNHRFPPEIISHAVWLYFRFTLSYRDVEEMLFARGIVVTYEAIRKWCRKFGQDYANQIRRRRPRTGDKWHLDEVFLTINGQPFQHGYLIANTLAVETCLPFSYGVRLGGFFLGPRGCF
jgi:putative transposase